MANSTIKPAVKQLFHSKEVTPYNESIVTNPDLKKSLGIRFLQFTFVVLNLVFAGFIVNESGGAYGRGIYIIVILVLTIIYLVSLFMMPFVRVLTPPGLVFIEFFFGLLWLIGFALITDDFGSVDCLGVQSCKLGKSIIAFSLLLWISFFIISGYINYKSLPPVKLESLLKCQFNDSKFQLGGIFFIPAIDNVFEQKIGYQENNLGISTNINPDAGNVVVDFVIDPDTTQDVSMHQSSNPTRPPPTPPTTLANGQ